MGELSSIDYAAEITGLTPSDIKSIKSRLMGIGSEYTHKLYWSYEGENTTVQIKKLWRGWAVMKGDNWFTMMVLKPYSTSEDPSIVAAYYDLANSNDDVYHCFFAGEYAGQCSYSYDDD